MDKSHNLNDKLKLEELEIYIYNKLEAWKPHLVKNRLKIAFKMKPI